MHAQLQELENKILANMAEMQGKSAREAAASLGQTLQKEGVVGVTEEVRDDCSSDTLLFPWKSYMASSSCVFGHDRSSWLEVRVYILGPVWVVEVYKACSGTTGSSPAGQVHGYACSTYSAPFTSTDYLGHILASAPDRQAGPAALQ